MTTMTPGRAGHIFGSPRTRNVKYLIEHGAFLLDSETFGLRLAHNRDVQNPTWTDPDSAKVAYDDMKETSQALYPLAERMEARAA